MRRRNRIKKEIETNGSSRERERDSLLGFRNRKTSVGTGRERIARGEEWGEGLNGGSRQSGFNISYVINYLIFKDISNR